MLVTKNNYLYFHNMYLNLYCSTTVIYKEFHLLKSLVSKLVIVILCLIFKLVKKKCFAY